MRHAQWTGVADTEALSGVAGTGSTGRVHPLRGVPPSDPGDGLRARAVRSTAARGPLPELISAVLSADGACLRLLGDGSPNPPAETAGKPQVMGVGWCSNRPPAEPVAKGAASSIAQRTCTTTRRACAVEDAARGRGPGAAIGPWYRRAQVVVTVTGTHGERRCPGSGGHGVGTLRRPGRRPRRVGARRRAGSRGAAIRHARKRAKAPAGRRGLSAALGRWCGVGRPADRTGPAEGRMPGRGGRGRPARRTARP